MNSAYSAAGVDTSQAGRGVEALVEVLRSIDPGRDSLAIPLPGHYASVIRVSAELGIALATDSVGSKVIVAEGAGRFSTIGVDCVAMNVNDLICVGATPLAMLDYLAVERADEAQLRELAVGLRTGAELAGVEIPGGEVCQLPEVIRGHPSPLGFDLVGSAFGILALEKIVDGALVAPGDVVIGLPSSGIHSNGLTLARRALLEGGDLALDDRPGELGGDSVADVLLEPTAIYVRAIRQLLESTVQVHGLAHITGDGVLNLLRLGDGIGYEISDPLPVHPVFDLIARHGEVEAAEMWEVFNMGCGFCVIVAPQEVDAALELL
ncbi:MAG: phosphoribosylformylglycinamidine cyclo-ligase, partial [Solirubrobacterales bacterium]|nr:phosphoribosylformylglycinamidine cyclo-ligase [Solirubrobacterales bacterium]